MRVADSIWRISLPTPWQVGAVNVYLVEDDPLTLVDTGPLTDEAIAPFERDLAALGHSLATIRRVVVTHQHIDHCGQSARLLEPGRGELVALDAVVPWIEHYEEGQSAEADLAEDLLHRHGCTPDQLGAVVGGMRHAVRFGAGAAVTRVLADGEPLEFAGRRLRAHLLPGHSPTDTVFHDEERGVVFGGDLLLAGIPSIPLITPELGSDGRPAPPLPGSSERLRSSLRKLADLSAGRVLPGHGAPITDPAGTIASRLAARERTAARIAALLSGKPRTAAELVAELRGQSDEDLNFFRLSDMLGHLEHLGAVEGEPDAAGVVRFTAP